MDEHEVSCGAVWQERAHQRAGEEARQSRLAQALADTTMRQAVATLGAELAAVQARLAALEAAPATRAAPERRAGSVTGRAPLPECTPASPIASAAALTTLSPTQRPGWRDRGQVILVVALLLVVFTWPLRPQVGHEATGQPAVSTTAAPTAGTAAGAVGAPVAAQPMSGTRCAGLASERCAGNDGRLATPAACLAPVGAAGENCVPDAAAAAPPSPTAAISCPGLDERVRR
jgi:hypothetical protein